MTKNILALTLSINLALWGCSQESANKEVGLTKTSQAQTLLADATQSDIDLIGNGLDISYSLVTNVPSEKCDQSIEHGNCFTVKLTFTANDVIKAKNWEIYFSQISPIQSFESDEFQVEHINGDLHRISLSDAFIGFQKGEQKELIFRAMFWSLSEHDAMPNYLVVADNLSAKVIESTRVKVDAETGIETLPFVTPFTDEIKQFKRTKDDKTQWLTPEGLFARNDRLPDANLDISTSIIPTPKKIVIEDNAARVNLAEGVSVAFNNVKPEMVQAALSRLNLVGIETNSNSDAVSLKLNVQPNSNSKIGSYHLTVNTDGIEVIGVDPTGVFNGLQSLAALVSLDDKNLPTLSVEDEPHYEFRGMLVDVARNFHSKAFILDLLDQMGAYKLNKLHLHLGDDEGWRLEIPSLPELTEVGAFRCFDPQENDCLVPQLGAGIDKDSPVNGFYSVADYQEILRYASARHIQVIPSLDMPGHSRAAVKAMTARYNKYMASEDKGKAEQFLLHDPLDKTKYSSVQFYNDNTINVCLESSFDFVTEVMSQVKKIHHDAGQPLTRYHIGADETAGAWVDSPACEAFLANNTYGVKDKKDFGAYFVERVSNLLAGLGIEAAAWMDGLEHTRTENMPAVVQANAWGLLPWEAHKTTHELANRNWQIVVSTPDALYFDFPYEADPKEHGYYWASRQVNTEKVFQFMPDNLPVHAEFWLDRQDLPFESDDTKRKDEQGNIVSEPLNAGRKFLGIQGQLWSENTRSDDMSEHKVFPRLLALAERAWHQAEWAVPYNYEGFKYTQSTGVFTNELKQQRDQAWANFSATLGTKELRKLELSNIAYRLPTVGAQIIDGQLHANAAFPGLKIEFKYGENDWQPYEGIIAVEGKVAVRASTSDGKRKGRTTYLAQ